MAQKQVPVESPVGGVNQVCGREGQPTSTCWDASNVLPFDFYGRRRVAQRPGLSKRYTTQLDPSLIQGMLAVNQVIYATGAGGGSTIAYSEPFTDLASFKASWSNVPSTWTVSGNKLHIPAGWAPTGSTAVPTYTAGIDAASLLQFKVNFTYAGAVASTNGVLAINYGVNGTVPTQSDVDNSNVDLEWNFSGTINGGTDPALLLTVAPVVFSSTTADAAFASASPNKASSTEFVMLGNYASNLASMVGAGVATDSNAVGPNTGSIAVTLSGTSFPFLAFANAVSPHPSGVSVAVDTIQFITTAAAQRQTTFASLLIAVNDGFVWIGTPSPTNTITKAAGQSTALLSSTPFVSMAAVNFTSLVGSTDPNAIGSAVYIVDGVTPHIRALNLATSTMTTLVPKSSTNLPPSTVGLCCNWRGRLVLAGDPVNPQNFYMSRQGDPSDWDYSQTDPAAAVAGNLSRSGQIGEPIISLIPYTDDIMLVGCSNSLWMLQGDPADGGSIVRVSDQMGIVGKDAWCVDPAGTLYFIASGGLYSVKPIWEMYQPPQLLTAESLNQFFVNQPWNQIKISMVWDADHHYLHMYFTNTIGTLLSTHLIYDARTGGLWPQVMGSVLGPTSAILYNGNNSVTDRAVLLGGWDGFIRKFDYTATDDDGFAINSRVILGPFKPFPEAGLLTACTVDLGEVSPLTASSTFTVVARLASGPDAFSVTEGAAHSSTVTGFVLDRRQKTLRQRLRGGWFTLGLFNGVDNGYFSFESAVLEFSPAGRNRERR